MPHPPAPPPNGGLTAFSFLEALDGSDLGIVITDTAERIVWASEALESYFHLSRGDVIGMRWRAFVTCFVRPMLAHPAPRPLEKNTVTPERILLDVQAGPAVRHLEHWCRPVTQGAFAGGRLHHFADVTHRRPRRPAPPPTVFDLASRTLADEGK